MVILYNIFLYIASLIAEVIGLFHPKFRKFVQGRRGVLKRLSEVFNGNTASVIWVHCASLGEFEQGRPVIEALKNEFPNLKIFLTFFSPSGYEVRKNYFFADYVCYLPWDSASNAKKLVSIVKPRLAIFVKYEYWYHYTKVLKNKSIPILSISSIFRAQQLFFHSYGGFYRGILKNFSYFFVQNDESVKLLKSININRCERAGDTRFDSVHHIVKAVEEIPIAKKFKSEQKVFVVGSCWQEDLDVLIPFINEDRLKFILAPHEISEAFIITIEKSLLVKSVRYSDADNKQNLEGYNVLIIDNIGLLSRLYRYGEFAYVGGAFGKGLHNILEAACYGVPIFFGNRNYEKFQEAVDLMNRGGAFEVADYMDFKSKYELLNQPENFLLACEVTRQYVEENLGASEKILKYCRQLLKT